MTHQIIKQSTLDHKRKAIASLLFGIIGIITITGFIYDGFPPQALEAFGFPRILRFTEKIVEPFGAISYLFLLAPIIGLILGILGLKSTKKNMAIGGIVLSIIGLFGLIIFFLLALGFATGM